LNRAGLRTRVDSALGAFLARRREHLATIDQALLPLADAIEKFVLGGGKRLRPAFAYWGYRAAGGVDRDEVVAGAAALEFVQASALIHDDVMDGSDTRRGEPAVHRHFASLHRGSKWLGEPEDFGTASAILLGDLCLVWSDELLHSSGLDPVTLARARSVFDEMRTEVTVGQYLDIHNQVTGDTSLQRAGLVARFKSAKYTVERPLLLGAALADAPAEIVRAYSAFGLPLGEAFQLRDDVLGVFGDPAVTGKPAGDDLREGKRTVLVALARSRLSGGARRALDELLGDPELDGQQISMLQSTIRESGAVDQVERIIEHNVALAQSAVAEAPVTRAAREQLSRLAERVTQRTS
jgi:geranylgeranyl diphosphate synthase type I